jgi:hypothetical protein
MASFSRWHVNVGSGSRVPSTSQARCSFAVGRCLLEEGLGPGLDAVGQDVRIPLGVGVDAECGDGGQLPHVSDERLAVAAGAIG